MGATGIEPEVDDSLPTPTIDVKLLQLKLPSLFLVKVPKLSMDPVTLISAPIVILFPFLVKVPSPVVTTVPNEAVPLYEEPAEKVDVLLTVILASTFVLFV